MKESSKIAEGLAWPETVILLDCEGMQMPFPVFNIKGGACGVSPLEGDVRESKFV